MAPEEPRLSGQMVDWWKEKGCFNHHKLHILKHFSTEKQEPLVLTAAIDIDISSFCHFVPQK